MKVYRLIRPGFKAHLGHGICIGYGWLSVSHVLENHFWPILTIVFFLDFFKFVYLTLDQGGLFGSRCTALPNQATFYAHCQKVWCVSVMRLAEGYYSTHRTVSPVSEGAYYVGNLTRFNRLEVWVWICQQIYCIHVIAAHLFVPHLR